MTYESLHDQFMRICDEHKAVHEEFMACHFWQIRKSNRLYKRSNELMAEMWDVWDLIIERGPFKEA